MTLECESESGTGSWQCCVMTQTLGLRRDPFVHQSFAQVKLLVLR